MHVHSAASPPTASPPPRRRPPSSGCACAACPSPRGGSSPWPPRTAAARGLQNGRRAAGEGVRRPGGLPSRWAPRIGRPDGATHSPPRVGAAAGCMAARPRCGPRLTPPRRSAVAACMLSWCPGSLRQSSSGSRSGRDGAAAAPPSPSGGLSTARPPRQMHAWRPRAASAGPVGWAGGAGGAGGGRWEPACLGPRGRRSAPPPARRPCSDSRGSSCERRGSRVLHGPACASWAWPGAGGDTRQQAQGRSRGQLAARTAPQPPPLAGPHRAPQPAVPLPENWGIALVAKVQ